jgi:glycosyltransferase involved in cell wall biosynthesis
MTERDKPRSLQKKILIDGKTIVQLLIMKLAIQIPAYNEAEHLPAVLAELPRQLPGVEEIVVVVVDDGSTDNTAQTALEHGADYVLQHRRNRGLSKAFIDGVQFCLALGADIIVNTDADNQYPGSQIGKLIEPLLQGRADLVIGDRQTLENKHFSPFKRMMEHLGSRVIRRVSNTNVPDTVSGFRAFSRYAALRMQVYNPYSYTLETLIQAGKGQMKIESVPIETNATTRASRLHKGMFNFIWRQGGAIIRSYVLYQPLRTFLSIGAVLFLIGAVLLGRFLVYYLLFNGSSRFIQSVSIGGTFLVAGITLIMFGFLGDAMRANRQISEESMIHQRDTAIISDLENLSEFRGHPVFSKQNPVS